MRSLIQSLMASPSRTVLCDSRRKIHIRRRPEEHVLLQDGNLDAVFQRMADYFFISEMNGQQLRKVATYNGK